VGIDKDFQMLDRCEHYSESRIYRVRAMLKRLDDADVMDYAKAGCYECDGDDRKCQGYINPLEEYLKLLFFKL
jgi:hypothetical protein